MKSLFFYLIQVIVASAILYGYYYLALRNKKFHRYNRFYLLAAFVISIIVPFFNIPVYFTNTDTDSSFILHTITSFSTSGVVETPVPISYSPNVKTTWFTWQHLSYSFYIVIAFIVMIRILFSLKKIRHIIRNNPVEKLEDIHFVNTEEPGTPFSFFRWMFWNRQIELRSEKGEQIFRHELFHIQQRHSRDIIFMELMMVIFWINPFFHLIKKEVKAIHEFLADQFAVKENQHWEYAELLLMQALKTKQHLVNPFFHNQIKRRIAMITLSQKTSYQYLRKLLVVPVAVVIIALFAFKYKTKESDKLINNPLEKTITVVNASQKENLGQQEKLNSRIANNNVTLTKNAINISVPKDSIPSKTSLTFIDEGITLTGQGFIIEDTSDILHVMLKEILNKKSKVSEFQSQEKSIIQDTSSQPLVIIDGVKQKSGSNFKDIDPVTIESINVFKELSAIAKYGNEGKNGAIEIFTKKKNDSELKEINSSQLNEVVIVGYREDKDRYPNLPNNDIAPPFVGGETEWRKHLERNINSLVAVDNGAPTGTYTTVTQFLVNKEGTTSEFKSLTNQGYGMEEEALRVIQSAKKWEPTVINGEKVNAYKKQPVTFIVENDKSIPKITKEDFQKSSVNKLLELNKETEILSYSFAIYFPNGVAETKNKGSLLSNESKMLLNRAEPGTIFSLNYPRIIKDGKEMSASSKIYKLVD